MVCTCTCTCTCVCVCVCVCIYVYTYVYTYITSHSFLFKPCHSYYCQNMLCLQFPSHGISIHSYAAIRIPQNCQNHPQTSLSKVNAQRHIKHMFPVQIANFHANCIRPFTNHSAVSWPKSSPQKLPVVWWETNHPLIPTTRRLIPEGAPAAPQNLSVGWYEEITFDGIASIVIIFCSNPHPNLSNEAWTNQVRTPGAGAGAGASQLVNWGGFWMWPVFSISYK